MLESNPMPDPEPAPKSKRGGGGARPGAGRKPLAESIHGVPPGEPSVNWTLRLPACVAAELDRTEARAALLALWRKSPKRLNR